MKLIILVAIVLVSSSCKIIKTSEYSDSVIIHYSLKSGRGIGPEYDLSIYTSGKVIYKGEKNTEMLGEFENKISKQELKSLKQEFANISFMNLEDEYSSKITDLPTRYITLNINKSTKTIRDYHGAPEELHNLEKQIENIIKKKGWKKID